VGAGSQNQEPGKVLGGTHPRSRWDKGPRGHTAQENSLPQNSGGILVHKNVDKKADSRQERDQQGGKPRPQVGYSLFETGHLGC